MIMTRLLLIFCFFLAYLGVSAQPGKKASITYIPKRVEYKYLEYKDKTRVKVVYYPDLKEYFLCGKKVSPRNKLENDQRILPQMCTCVIDGSSTIPVAMNFSISQEEAESLIRTTGQYNVKMIGSTIQLKRGDDQDEIKVDDGDALIAYVSNYTKDYLNVPKKDLPAVAGSGLVHFAYDSSVLTPEAFPYLDHLSASLRESGAKVTVKGYSAGEGNAAYGLKLSKDRANSVKTYLVNSGVNASQVVTQGHGEANPLASNDTEEGRVMNRRVETVKN